MPANQENAAKKNMSIDIQSGEITVKLQLRRLEGDTKLLSALTARPEYSDPRSIEFDMADVIYVNSLGIAEFISVYRYYNVEKGKKVKIIFSHLRPEIAKIFHLVELGQISDIIIR